MEALPPPPPAIIITGTATYYSPGVFELVWNYRSRTMQPCADCVGFAAMADCTNLDRRIVVRNTRTGEKSGKLHVIDCAEGADRAAFEQRGHIAELPYWLAMAWGMKGPIPVIVTMEAER